MKAVMWYGRQDVRLVELPVPRPRAGEVLLRIGACGICGTDLDEYMYGPIFISQGDPHPLTGRKAPIVLGHEFAGEVVEVGPEVSHLRPGDRVASDVLVSCGTCHWCLRHQVVLCERLAALGLSGDGGMAEYCSVPESTCCLLPEAVSLEEGAFAEPLAVAVRAVRRAELKLGNQVLILGAGTIGLLAMQVARASGADVTVADPLAERRDLALRLGASAAFDPLDAAFDEAVRASAPVGPDVAIEASGSGAAFAKALQTVRKGGRVVLVGIPVEKVAIDFLPLVAGEREVVGSLSHVWDEDFVAAVRLLGTGAVRVTPLVGERLSLDRAVERGFSSQQRGLASGSKILVVPGQEQAR